ncbi:MAG: hypothetical protein RLZZ561_465 [Pseudomonadota bacterium]|jgi:hypothetical protein
MPADQTALNLLLTDTDWLVHRYDDRQDAFQFRQVPWPRRAEIPFLSNENLAQVGEARSLAADDIGLSQISQSPLHFIFHSAFCASTLLTKVLSDGGLSTLSEPQVLNDLIGALRRGQSGPDVARRLDQSLALLARPMAGTDAVVVKPSNLVNHLARAMLTLRPKSRAILLYAPLPIFLTSVARKGLWCRLWVRELLEYQIDLGMMHFGFTAKDYLRMSDLQVAALGWLVQHQSFQSLGRGPMAEQVLMIDSERLTQHPEQVLPKLCQHLAPQMDQSRIEAILKSSALTQHSKFGYAFTPQERLQEQQQAQKAHADEIDKVTLWAQELARSAGVTLPS